MQDYDLIEGNTTGWNNAFEPNMSNSQQMLPLQIALMADNAGDVIDIMSHPKFSWGDFLVAEQKNKSLGLGSSLDNSAVDIKNIYEVFRNFFESDKYKSGRFSLLVETQKGLSSISDRLNVFEVQHQEGIVKSELGQPAYIVSSALSQAISVCSKNKDKADLYNLLHDKAISQKADFLYLHTSKPSVAKVNDIAELNVAYGQQHAKPKQQKF